MPLTQYYGTGKRKTSVARVFLRPGTGQIFINEKKLEEYFPTERMQATVLQPLQLTGFTSTYDINVNVLGGGVIGQASAVRHGISKALLQVDAGLRQKLKKAGLITRDPRVKERKKYGQKAARARFQFSKR
ncbi:MAG: 30S ribosomal protein S9 [bacterium]